MIVETFMAFLCRIFCFTSYVNNKGSFPRPLTPDEEREQYLKMKDGDMKARETLIRHNLRLVAHVVKKYQGAGEADDLISVGSIGLIKGIESFEYGKGTQPATYLARCIDNEILMYIRANKKHRVVQSLAEPVGTDKEGNEITLMDILPAPEDGEFARVEREATMDKIIGVIGRVLTKREKIVVCLRYGLCGARVHTQLEIAEKMKISRSYVSRIEKKAVGKITKAIGVNGR